MVNKTLHKTRLILIFAVQVILMLPSPSRAADDFWGALTGGGLDFSSRYRFEHVSDDLAPDKANASTIRTTLGYRTGFIHDFNGRILIQDVRSVGLYDFNDATGRPGAKTRYAVVADPADTDFIEGYIGYRGIPATMVRLGRQIITYRDAPFHRFIGNVLWRQNWQNFDAVTLQNTSLPATTISYAYVWNVNRIFSEHAVPAARANFDSDSHFLNIRYTGLQSLQAEGYVYLLDFANAPGSSVATYGIRLSGSHTLTGNLKALYAAEMAVQDDYGDNPARVHENYYLGEIGAGLDAPGPVESLVLKFTFEKLEGNGSSAFQTPLATGHAYQGWTDRFLVTPSDGIEDYYLTAILKAFGAAFTVSYHNLNSDHLGYSYGEEFDLSLVRTFYQHYTVGLKYGNYAAHASGNNAAGATAADVSKFWGWVQVSF